MSTIYFGLCLAENAGVEPEVKSQERALNPGFNSVNVAALRFSLLRLEYPESILNSSRPLRLPLCLGEHRSLSREV
jgi:hypothetical protein